MLTTSHLSDLNLTSLGNVMGACLAHLNEFKVITVKHLSSCWQGP